MALSIWKIFKANFKLKKNIYIKLAPNFKIAEHNVKYYPTNSFSNTQFINVHLNGSFLPRRQLLILSLQVQ
jgi:hypothetical protein